MRRDRRRPLLKDSSGREIQTRDEALMTQALVLCFEYGLSNKEIAEKLQKSESHISRLLKEAEAKGLVRFSLYLPNNEILASRLGLLFPSAVKNPLALVAPTAPRRKGAAVRVVGLVAARHFEKVAKKAKSITVDGGQTVASVIELLHPREFRDLVIYPIAGSLPKNPDISPEANLWRFYGRYGREAVSLKFFPLARAVDQEEKVAEARIIAEEAAEAEIFLLGVGVPGPNSSLNRALADLGLTFDSIRAPGQVGTCGYNAVDGSGRALSWRLDDELFKVSAESIKAAAATKGKEVIIVARGTDKARAIHAIIKGGWCNSIVTDEPTAKAVIRVARSF